MKNTEQLVNEILSPPKKKAANIPIEKLHTFNGHPFKILDNEEMEILTGSIRQQGILSPLIVRPIENKQDEYEVISGHRRLYASVKAGLAEVPALISIHLTEMRQLLRWWTIISTENGYCPAKKPLRTK